MIVSNDLTIINDEENDDENEETPKKKLKRSSSSSSGSSVTITPAIKSFIKWNLFKNLIKTSDDIQMLFGFLFDIQIYISSFNNNNNTEDTSLNELRLELISYTMQFLAICLVGTGVGGEDEDPNDDLLILTKLKKTFFNDNLKETG